jgi:RHS repeat-associated protein
VNLLGARGIEGIISIHASGSASLNWLMYDGHGNVVRTIDTGFGLSAYQWRGVWGERQTGTLQTGKGYCANLGHQEDETGLVYMRARYYEPTTGRFISEDPARDGVNWYLYADGNAVGRVDASGRESLGELMVSMSFSAILQGLMNGIISFLQSGNFWSGFIGGAIGGALSVIPFFGLFAGVAGAFASSFITNLMNGAGLFNSLKRALVSAGIAGAGTWLAVSFGDIRNAQLTFALIAFDADALVDVATSLNLF